MAIKSYELEHGTFAKAHDDEPLFILRAQDVLAPAIARLWVEHAKVSGVPMDKIREAEANIASMERYKGPKKLPGHPMPGEENNEQSTTPNSPAAKRIRGLLSALRRLFRTKDRC